MIEPTIDKGPMISVAFKDARDDEQTIADSPHARKTVDALLRYLSESYAVTGYQFRVKDSLFTPTVAVWNNDDGGFIVHVINAEACPIEYEESGDRLVTDWDSTQEWNLTFLVCDGIYCLGMRTRPCLTGDDDGKGGMRGMVTLTWSIDYDDMSEDMRENV